MSYDALGNILATTDVNGTSAPSEGFWAPPLGSVSTQGGTSRYESLTGRLQQHHSDRDSTFLSYDRAGNVVFEMSMDPLNPLNGVDRVMYYGGDGRLRALDTRNRNSNSEFHAIWEDYRYDPLGRRVQVRTLRWCDYTDPRCHIDTVHRTVWDGSQVLAEIRMVEAEGDSDADPTEQQRSDNFDPNPMLGRVLFTHGPGIDQPLSAIRMGYGDRPNALTYQRWPAFSVIPLWNERGQAPFVTFGSGTRTFCSPAAGRCLGTLWLLAWNAYGARRNGVVMSSVTEGVWLGGIMEDQQDASGLLYRRNRYYDPATGRFTQEDPIGLAGGLNAYGFADGDPVSYSDPFGLKVCAKSESMRRHISNTYRMHIQWDSQGCVSDPSLTTRRSGSAGYGNLQTMFDALVGSSIVFNVRDVHFGSEIDCSGGVCDVQIAREQYAPGLWYDSYSGTNRRHYGMRVAGGYCDWDTARWTVGALIVHELGHGYALVHGKSNYKKERHADPWENEWHRIQGEPARCRPQEERHEW